MTQILVKYLERHRSLFLLQNFCFASISLTLIFYTLLIWLNSIFPMQLLHDEELKTQQCGVLLVTSGAIGLGFPGLSWCRWLITDSYVVPEYEENVASNFLTHIKVTTCFFAFLKFPLLLVSLFPAFFILCMLLKRVLDPFTVHCVLFISVPPKSYEELSASSSTASVALCRSLHQVLRPKSRVGFSLPPPDHALRKSSLTYKSPMASQDKHLPLPKFGEWDVNNPASAEGFTVIFSKARDEKNGNGPAPDAGKSTVKNDSTQGRNDVQRKFCCF
ncbi:hypothetical protein VNO77_19120 [Canavalia gladiata]|uniref:RIN4 pathogenic type III effector avirulence factor Avr cleavage site domain-containing protein n=1 Tax=Canavalia gladiata TaxID=3824 RepID=A0AAN9QPB4_CANGL